VESIQGVRVRRVIERWRQLAARQAWHVASQAHAAAHRQMLERGQSLERIQAGPADQLGGR
jgi:hypothetical protein